MTKRQAQVGCLSFVILWAALYLGVSLYRGVAMPIGRQAAAYQIMDRAFGPAQVTLWIRVKPDADAAAIQDWCDELREKYAESGKGFMIAVLSGPKTGDGRNVVGSYEDGLFIDTR